MRVLFITNDFPSSLQPAKAPINLQMARALARDHEVAVISPVSWIDELRIGSSNKPIERVRIVDRIRVWHPRYFYTPTLLRAWYGWFLWWSVASVARRVVSEFKPDIVLAYWLHPDGEVAVRLAREAGLPVVVMSGGSDVLVLTRRAARRRRIVNVLQRADAVVCVSRHLQSAIEAMGIPSSKVHVVYRGVDRRKFCPGDRAKARARLGLDCDRRLILWVGRMVPAKGLHTLIDACAALKGGGLEFRLCLLGDGPLRGSLLKRATRLGIVGNVHFVGPVDHDDLPDWYRAANLTVMPSVSEGVPNVLREAISCGSPFVATDVGGVGEIADLRIDRLVPVGAADALAGAIQEALCRSEAATRRVEPATWAESTDRMTEVFLSCVGIRAPGHPVAAAEVLTT